MKIKKLILLILTCGVIADFVLGQQFTQQNDIILTAVSDGNVAWGDYDNDGDLDILLTGDTSTVKYSLKPISKIYKNDGNNSFTEQSDITLPGIRGGSAEWIDYDNDGDLDIFISGNLSDTTSTSIPITRIFKNNGENNFIEQSDIDFIEVTSGCSAWGDYNNDGNFDLAFAGWSQATSSRLSAIYKNKGDNNFLHQLEIEIEGGNSGDTKWGDYDNDGDLDLLITGYTGSSFFSSIYKNNNDGTFSIQSDINLPTMWGGTAEWGDYDNDNDLDILINGTTRYLSSPNISSIYNNDNGIFTEQTEILLDSAGESTSMWGDYNNDGLRDIILAGNIGEWNKKSLQTAIYKNNDGSSFTKQSIELLEGICRGSVAWGDYDNDGDLDILLCGNIDTLYGNKRPITRIYKNNAVVPNSKPDIINNLQETVEENKVTFSWEAASDNNQDGGLNYNLYVYNTDLSTYARPAHAFRKSEDLNGRRLIVKDGEIQGTSYSMILQKGNYTWSVQAIDAGFAGGEFANERSFTVETVLSTGEYQNEVLSIFPNPVSDFIIIDFGKKIMQEIDLVDISGIVILHKTINSSTERIDLSILPKGIYFLNIQTMNHFFVKTIIKE
jgi:hypothetical protein